MSDLHPSTKNQESIEQEEESTEQQEEPELQDFVQEDDDEYIDDEMDLQETEKKGKSFENAIDDENNSNKVKESKKKKKVNHFIISRLQKLKKINEKKFSLDPTYATPPYPYAYNQYYDVDFAASGCCFNYVVELKSDSVSGGENHDAKISSKKLALASYSSSYDSFAKNLIEKNDFFAKECNVHQDISFPAED